jgi:DNA-binding transcriptional MerR regulator
MKPIATRRSSSRDTSGRPPADTADRAAAPDSAVAAEPRLRMRDLVRESGLPRETIHFYKLQGLLPEPIKTGRNTALYTQAHVERLHRIRELQERQFLPLKAIRAILEDTYEEGFTPDQEDLVRQVRASLAGWTGAQQRPSVPVADLVPARVSRRELRELLDAGLVAVHGSGSGARVSEDDAVILECWAQFKEAGLGPDQGVNPSELRLYDEAMERLIAREARLALRARAGAPAADLSRTVEQIGPVIGRLLGAMHRKRMRRFLAEVGGNSEAASD